MIGPGAPSGIELFAESYQEPPLAGSVPLAAEAVEVSFGGLHALKKVSLSVGYDEIVGLIGANGAGKTTFLDAVSGFVQPSDGSISAFGHELVGEPPFMRPYLGIGRSFQNARLFPGLTVHETLLVAAFRHRPVGVLSSVFRTAYCRAAERSARAWVDELIGTVGLHAFSDKLVREISTGTRRVVDLAVILTQRPRLLLLDEPTAGIAQREVEVFVPLLRRVRDDLGCSIMIIEHDIVLMAELCDRLYAFETGTVMAEGTPTDVLADSRVIASYLGADEAAIRRSGDRVHRPPRRRRVAPLSAHPSNGLADRH